MNPVPQLQGTKLVSTAAHPCLRTAVALPDRATVQLSPALWLSLFVCSQLHTTGIRYKSSTRVKRINSKRSLHADEAVNATAAAASSPPADGPASLSTFAAAQLPTTTGASSPSGLAKRGSVVPLVSTDILTQDKGVKKEGQRALKRSASKRKIRPGEEKEVTYVYEEKELKLAVCCAIM